MVVLGSSWGRFWSSGAPLRVVFGRSGGRFGAFSAFQLIDSTRQLINSSIQLINSSTHQPMALRHFLTRPGGLRAARLNPPPGPEGRDERRVRLFPSPVPKSKLSSIFGLIRIVLFCIGLLKPNVEEKVVEHHLFLSLVHFSAPLVFPPRAQRSPPGHPLKRTNPPFNRSKF